MRKNRPAAYRRHQRQVHIARRKRISHYQSSYAPFPAGEHHVYTDMFGKEHELKFDHSKVIPSEWYRHDGQYAKGKVHCSCPLCRPYKYDGAPSIATIKKTVSWEEQVTAMFVDGLDLLPMDVLA